VVKILFKLNRISSSFFGRKMVIVLQCQEILRELTLRGKVIAKSTTNTGQTPGVNRLINLKEYREHIGDYTPHIT
jgi:hypothetical protein